MTQNGLIIEGNGRELVPRENKILNALEGMVPEVQILKLKSYWQKNKEAPKPISRWAGVILYIILLTAIAFLAINLYYQGQVGGAVNYAKYTITLNWLVFLAVCLCAALFSLAGLLTCLRLVKNPKEKFLDLTDVESLRRANAVRKLVSYVLITAFMILYIFSGFWNIVTGIILILAVAFARQAQKEAIQRTLEDINTL